MIGEKKEKYDIPQEVVLGTVNDIIKYDKKIIKEKTTKYDIDLEEDEITLMG